jgi:hypothetical protein
MKSVLAFVGVTGMALITFAGSPQGVAPRSAFAAHAGLPPSPEALDDVVDRYCTQCHNERRLVGNLNLEDFDVADPASRAVVAERVIRKLRAGMMPPQGRRRPAGDTLAALAARLEASLDAAAMAQPDPGHKTFQRLNRAEYEASVRALLDVEIDAGDYLPLDTKSANFDNIADVQMLSATTLTTYLNAAAEVARLAVGDPDAAPSTVTYTNSGYASQWDRMEGAPRGTRGGVSVVHHFPADGLYTFQMTFEHTTTGGFYGRVTAGEEIDVSIDGEQVALLAVDRWMNVADPKGVMMETEPVFVTAGPHRVAAAFIRQHEGPVDDLLSRHEWSLADRQIGVSGFGITALAHMKDLIVAGPYETFGVSPTPSRARVFSCHPDEGAAPRECARSIVERLAREAYRRPVTEAEVDELVAFYDEGARRDGVDVDDAGRDGSTADDFERGVRTALQAILASPDFIFRFEEPPEGAAADAVYALRDTDLATRLSFFLWGTPPDDALLADAEAGRLSRDEVLHGHVDRMLADPRSEALATRFAAQWLRLDDLDKVHPDRLLFPDYHEQLAQSMRRETELFFDALVREDRSLLELYSADWTVVNERLALHYGIPGVVGEHFRKVSYPDDRRRGIFGHGSVLTLTSHANRTSPVLRGKWVMEVIMGSPPPPPPPGVPDLDEVEAADAGRPLTTRERMEQHRANPQCASCHNVIDPIGLALDAFDVTGRWRIKEQGQAIDTGGELYDGTPVESAADLRAALLSRPVPLVRTFTENLLAYAIGRRMEAVDQPWVRAVARRAEDDGYRMSAFIKGVVDSPAFRMQSAIDRSAARNP